MRFRVRHVIRYRYSKLVFCEPLTIRLRPRDDSSQALEHFSLEIWPNPAGISNYRDLEGNLVTKAWFAELTDCLSVSATSIIRTCEINPYSFLLPNDSIKLPVQQMDDAELADCYLVRDQPAPVVDEFAARIAEDARQDTVTFVARLAERIHSDFPTFVREQGDPWEPERTLNEQRGSCRDLSVLLLDACRSQGLPARFVSGYSWNDDANQDQHLHAWCEVYFPGAGWRGFDPATGLAVSDRHISVAAGRNPAAAAPTSGCFRGDASSRLETQVIVRPDSESPVPTSVDSSGG